MISNKEVHQRIKRNAPKVSSTLSLSTCLLAASVTPAAAVTYETFKNPFSKHSIWNMPIASGAQYQSAGLKANQNTNYFYTKEGIHQFKASDPIRKVIKLKQPVTTKDKNAFCSSSNRDPKTVLTEMRIPDSFLWNKRFGDGRIAFVLPDNCCDLPKGQVLELYNFERCSHGSDVGAYVSTTYKFFDSPKHHVTGEGYPKVGMHLGSYLSVLGGTIRAGEFTAGGALDPIPHTLKVSLGHGHLYYSAKDPTPGYRWPAKKADSKAPGAYKGTNPNVELGSLLAIKSSFPCSTLLTVPGKKLCRTLQVYGAYIPDSYSGSNGLMLSLEVYSPTDQPVLKELNTAYNVDLNRLPRNPSFKSDMDTIYSNLMVVTNTSPQSPKGPGK